MDTSNLYQAPQAELAEEHQATDSMFYVVGLQKFLILFLTTNGFYVLFWFYKNWKLIGEKTLTSYIAPLRAIFAIFFTHSLASIIDDEGFKQKKTSGSGLSWYATLFVVASIISSVTSNLVTDLTISASVLIITIIAQTFSIYKFQQVINIIEGEQAVADNSELSLPNYIFIVLGLLIWAGIVMSYLKL